MAAAKKGSYQNIIAARQRLDLGGPVLQQLANPILSGITGVFGGLAGGGLSQAASGIGGGILGGPIAGGVQQGLPGVASGLNGLVGGDLSKFDPTKAAQSSFQAQNPVDQVYNFGALPGAPGGPAYNGANLQPGNALAAQQAGLAQGLTGTGNTALQSQLAYGNQAGQQGLAGLSSQQAFANGVGATGAQTLAGNVGAGQNLLNVGLGAQGHAFDAASAYNYWGQNGLSTNAGLAGTLAQNAGQTYGQQQGLIGNLGATANAGANLAGQQLGNAQQAYGQQQALIGQLQQQAAGGGPGATLAQHMLQQATQQQNAQAASLLSSQRGLNPAVAARMIADSNAANNQQAALSASNLGLQQQLGAQQQLGSLLGNNQALGLQGAGLGLQQQAGAQGQLGSTLANAQGLNVGTAANIYGQNAGIGTNAAMNAYNSAAALGVGTGAQLLGNAANTGVNAANAGFGNVASIGAGTANNAYGNAASTGIGNAASLYNTGVGQQYNAASNQAALGLQNQNQIFSANNAQNATYQQGLLGTEALNQNTATTNQQAKNAITGGLINATGAIGAGAAGGAAKALMAAEGGAVPVMVPGHAAYAGNDARNDTVPADLSPGEIVIPRSVTQHPDAPWLAAKFVAQVLAGKGPAPRYAGGKKRDDEGGDTPPPSMISQGDAPPADTPANDGIPWLQALGKNLPAGAAPADNKASPPNAPGFADRFLDVANGKDWFHPGDKSEPLKAQTATADQVPMASAANALPQNPNFTGPPMAAAPGTPGSFGGEGGGANPFGYLQNAYGMQQNAFGQQAQGINDMAVAQASRAQAEKQAFDQSNVRIEKAMLEHKNALDALSTERQGLVDGVVNQTIDPTRYWSSMSTGNKILAGISVALSGIGSGLSGRPNMAVDIINKAIEQDINAQHAELGKKTTLLSLNMQKYGSLEAAYHATMMQERALVEGKVHAAAAAAGGDQANAQKEMLLGQLSQQQAQQQQMFGQMMIGRSFSQGAFTGPGGAQYRTVLSPQDRARAVTLPNGGIAAARDEKAASETTTALAHMQEIENQVKNAQAFMRNVGRTVPGSDKDATAENIKEAIALHMGQLNGLNRMTDTELAEFHKMVPSPGDWRQGRAAAKFDTIMNLINNKRNAEFQTLEGYNPGKAASAFQGFGK